MFKLKPLFNDRECPCVVICFSLTTARLDDYLGDVIKEVQALRHQGYVIFDMVLANANLHKNRYFSSRFDGTKFEEFAEIEDLEEVILNQSKEFYKSIPSDFISNNCLLTKVQRFILKRGL